MSHDPTAPAPPKPSSRPHLSPQFCFNSTALRDFFRLSRATVDDSLSLHLNSLLQPSRRPWLVANTPTPQYPGTVTGARTRRQIPGSICREFKDSILFPSWNDREQVLTYCEHVAEQSDADEDGADGGSSRWGKRPQMHMPSDKMTPPQSSSSPYSTTSQSPSDSPLLPQQQEADHAAPPPPAIMPPSSSAPRDFWGNYRPRDERTDPYSGRDYSYTRQGRAEELKSVLRSERGIEQIVRSRTWNILGERCLDDDDETSNAKASRPNSQQPPWEAEWKRWVENTAKA